MNKTKNTIVANQIEEAKTFFERSRGLLGRKQLSQGHALWIHHCSSIHTFFMKFDLDLIFVDKNLKVQSIYQNVKPWRVIIPGFSARSVFEFSAGQLNHDIIEKGDELYVSN
ncbi:MAG: DUF192 domain-containing protein [Bdellovibrionales bacterium]|nr:DUF192 domain-containing protein [Bdellovibrionales bacterium]